MQTKDQKTKTQNKTKKPPKPKNMEEKNLGNLWPASWLQ